MADIPAIFLWRRTQRAESPLDRSFLLEETRSFHRDAREKTADRDEATPWRERRRREISRERFKVPSDA
jgi:hypothetical protein